MKVRRETRLQEEEEEEGEASLIPDVSLQNIPIGDFLCFYFPKKDKPQIFFSVVDDDEGN